MLTPSRHGGPQARVSSPPSGRSTLITSAPRSPSSIAASGPASTREKSATRIPSSMARMGRASTSSRRSMRNARRLRPPSRQDRGQRPAAPGGAARAAARGAGRRRPRLVILGDGLELREAAHRDAVAIAAPFFDATSAARARSVIVLSGNHDHGLAAGWIDARCTGWIDARLQSEPAGFLGLEQRFAPHDAGPLARRLAEPGAAAVRLPGHLAARRRLRLPRPLRRRPRHGADVRAARRRHDGALRRPAARSDGATPDDYEAVLSPLYAWLHALTQRADHTIVSKGGGASSRSYTALTPQRSAARARAPGRLSRGGRRAQPRRPRAAAVEPVTDRAAPRLPAPASAR